MSGTLSIHGTSLTGSLSGNAVKCQLHATQPGSLPPPGMYAVQVPHHDALFGAVVLMHKAEAMKRPGVVKAKGKDVTPGAGDLVAHKMGPEAARGKTGVMKWFTPAETVQVQHPSHSHAYDVAPGSGRPDFVATKFYRAAGQTPDDKFKQPVALDPTYVLTSRAIPGRNCLVVTTGFSDLIAGLMASGGAVLSVE